jgi:hypothetical protein
MPLNDKKIISIIPDQASQVEERCPGYRKELIQVIAEIVEYERGHRVNATNIQKKIGDKCNAAASSAPLDPLQRGKPRFMKYYS